MTVIKQFTDINFSLFCLISLQSQTIIDELCSQYETINKITQRLRKGLSDNSARFHISTVNIFVLTLYPLKVLLEFQNQKLPNLPFPLAFSVHPKHKTSPKSQPKDVFSHCSPPHSATGFL